MGLSPLERAPHSGYVYSVNTASKVIRISQAVRCLLTALLVWTPLPADAARAKIGALAPVNGASPVLTLGRQQLLSLPISLIPTQVSAVSLQVAKNDGKPAVTALEGLLRHGAESARVAKIEGSADAKNGAEFNFMQSAALDPSSGGADAAVKAGEEAALMVSARGGHGSGLSSFATADSKPNGSQEVDPLSFAGFTAPGLDARLLPVVQVLQSEIGRSKAKNERLGHLLWALRTFLKDGGAVRYGVPKDFNGKEHVEVISNVLPDLKGLYIHQNYQTVNPRLQAAVLAMRLQQLYDNMNGRSWLTREAMMRQITALDEFLDGDPGSMEMLAQALNINNTPEMVLFQDLMENRLLMGFSLAGLQNSQADVSTAEQFHSRDMDQIKQGEQSVANIETKLGPVVRSLEKRDFKNLSEDQLLARKKELVASLGQAKGNLILLRAELALYANDTAAAKGNAELDVRLSVNPEHSGTLDLAAVRLVPVQKGDAIAPKLESAIALIRTTIAESKDHATRDLSYVLTALDKIVNSNGRIRFDFPTLGSFAYFQYIFTEIVLSWPFMYLHPVLVATLLVHELTHAADYFGIARPGEADPGPRPLTRETEYGAFTNQSIFFGNFDHQRIAEEIAGSPGQYDPVYSRKVFNMATYAFKALMDGRGSLEAMVSESYRELFGTHFAGLQTASAMEDELQKRLVTERKKYEQLEIDFKLFKAEASKYSARDRTNMARYEKLLALRRAKIILYQRQIAQLRKTMEEGEAQTPAQGAALLLSVPTSESS